MGEKMYNYELTAPFQNKNAGFSRWTFGKKDGKEYFLKEFLDPVYPDETSLSLNLRKERIQLCEEYEAEKKKLYESISRVSDGNLMRIHEFFRYDSHYYLAMEKVEAENITLEQIAKLPYQDRFLLCKTIAHSILKLHEAQIVHADIKANNILLKRTAGNKLVGKVIDLDASFFETNPPDTEDELVADQVYMAPEACLFICGEEVELTCKIDVFALGILFHQYLAGDLPGIDSKEYDYIFEAVLDDQVPVISSEVDIYMKTLLQGMLKKDPKERFSMKKVYAILREMDSNEVSEKEVIEEEKTMPPEYSFGFVQAGDLI